MHLSLYIDMLLGRIALIVGSLSGPPPQSFQPEIEILTRLGNEGSVEKNGNYFRILMFGRQLTATVSSDR